MATWVPGDQWDPGNPQNRDRTRVLQRQLRVHLLTWDPIGVIEDPNDFDDEYDSLISPLMHFLHDGHSITEIAAWLRNQLDRFGIPAERDAAREEELAVQLVDWWHAATR